MNILSFKEKIFKISTDAEFMNLAIELCQYQMKTNTFYKKYCDLLKINTREINSIEQIPFLPIEFFKTETILCNNVSVETEFYSSGTTSSIKSKHYIESLSFYEKSICESFKKRFGDIESYKFFCLTPEKKDAPNSSLVYMCNFFVEKTQNQGSGFYLKNLPRLANEIKKTQKKNEKFILIGLSFSILDFAKKHKLNLQNGYIIETGGMKNLENEMLKEELYSILRKNFQISNIQSEYGMTELLSQSYSLGNGEFQSPPWKKILIRDKYDPLKINNNSRGGINVIDLANIHSCAFIATNDFGYIKKDKFHVLGRLENTSIRGCNNLI